MATIHRKMEQCKIKPWNIRKLHFAIDRLQGTGKRKDRKEMHRELDAMTHLLCESHRMTLPDYGQKDGVPVSNNGANMAVFSVKKGSLSQEGDLQKTLFPCRLVEGERGDCLVCVVASAELAKDVAVKLESDSYIFMERGAAQTPTFSQYSKKTDDTGYYYLVQVNSCLPLQEPSAVFDAIAQIDALVEGLDEKTRKILSEGTADDFQEVRKRAFFMHAGLGKSETYEAVLDWLKNLEFALVELPEQEKKLVHSFNHTRFELSMAHLGYAVKKIAGDCRYVVFNTPKSATFGHNMQTVAERMHAIKFQMAPAEHFASIAECLRDEVLRYDKEKYYSVEALNENRYYPINASLPERLGTFMRAVYYWGAALRLVLDLK